MGRLINKWKKSPAKDKVYVICITIATVLSVYNTFIAPYLEARRPQPNTRVIAGGRELFTTIGSDYARWKIIIKNEGDAEAKGIDLEVEFPDGTRIIWDKHIFMDWRGNWSRKPDYTYSNDNYCMMRWNYLPPHCKIIVDFQLQLPTDATSEKIQPKHVVVSASGEKSPIFEYP